MTPHCTDKTETAERLSGQLGDEALKHGAKHTGDRRRGPAETSSGPSVCCQMHTCRTLFERSRSPVALGRKVAMLVFMSNSTSISSGVVIYFRVDGFFCDVQKRKYTV